MSIEGVSSELILTMSPEAKETNERRKALQDVLGDFVTRFENELVLSLSAVRY